VAGAEEEKLALSTWRDYRSIFDLYAIPHFGRFQCPASQPAMPKTS